MTFSEYLADKEKENDRTQSAADRIRAIRKLTGLSQAAFGKLYEIPLRTIQSWELGEREAPAYVIGLLERVVREDFGADGEEVAKEEPEKAGK